MRSYDLGPAYVTGEHYALLRHVVSLRPRGIALEFGVGRGESTRIIADELPVIGFDSFLGLPEDWRPGYPQGSFSQDGWAPEVDNARFVIGQFDDTLLGYFTGDEQVGLVHVDCDLYSSTKTVLDHVGPLLRPGTYVVFDEWHGYRGAQRYEQRAWVEYADSTDVQWTVVGHGHQQWGIRIE